MTVRTAVDTDRAASSQNLARRVVLSTMSLPGPVSGNGGMR
jgi:hypothetical protein